MMLRFLFTVLMCNLLCTLKAQSDSSYRSTGFTLFIGGSINSFDNEPRVALLDCATIGLGLHRNNGNLYLAYSRGNATTATFDGLGLGGELYLEKSKLSCDAILAVNRGSLFGWSTGLVTLGGIVVTDDQAFFSSTLAYWYRIKKSRFYAGAAYGYQFGKTESAQGGWFINEKVTDRSKSNSHASAIGLHYELYVRKGFFVIGSLLIGGNVSTWKWDYIKKDSSGVIEEHHSLGQKPYSMWMNIGVKSGWIF